MPPAPAAVDSTAPQNTSGRPMLQRSASRQSSIHAQTSLRRMLTHETGTGPAVGMGKYGMDHNHPEEQEHEHEGPSSSSSRASRPASPTKSDDHSGALREARQSRTDEKDIESQRRSAESDEGPHMEGEEGGGVEAKEQKKVKGRLELQDQTNLLPVRQVITVFIGLSMALFCSLLDQTIVVTALPTLGQAFGRSDIVSWVGTSYLLTSTAMQPLYGRLSDIFGRKPTLLAACLIFFLGSLACSISANMIQLICFRAIQGIGGGGILTLSMIIVSDIVTLKERGKYQGIIGVVIAAANSLGPLIGGLLTEKATWRWSFWLSLPLTAIATAVILFLLPLKTVRGDVLAKLRAIDWIGSALTLLWAVLFLIGLSWAGTQYAWSSPAVLVPIILAVVLLASFLFVETHVRLPVIPLYIFKSRTVSSAMASTFFSGIAFYSTLYYLPTYLQVVHGDSPIQSGVQTLPLAAVQTTTAFVAGYVTSKTGDYWYSLVIGFCIWTIGLGLMTMLSTTTSRGAFVAFQIVVAIGAGQTFQTSLLAIQADVERKDMATATGTRNFMRMLGGTVGLAACGAIVNNVVRTELGSLGLGEAVVSAVLRDPTFRGGWQDEVPLETVREAYARGISSTFYLMLPLTAISALLTVFFVKKVSLKRDDDAAKKEEGKQWVADRRAKRQAKKGGRIPAAEDEEKARYVGGFGNQKAAEEGTKHVRKGERVMEEMAEVIDEAAGVMPTNEQVASGPAGASESRHTSRTR